MTTERKMEFFGGGWRQVDDADAEKSPVIDAHSHIFRRFATGSGAASAALTLKLWQYHLRDFTDFWRKEDGARVKEPLLDFPSDDINAMPDLNFRFGRYGQAELTVDGVDYVMQFYPPALENLEATPERMIAEMEVAGVDRGVLQSDHVYGANINEYYAEAMRRYPDRFIALAQIRETEGHEAEELARLEHAVTELGCMGLYFSVELFALRGYVDRIDDAKFKPLWQLVRRLGIPIFWYIDARKQDRVAGFMERVAELSRWADAHDDIPSVITHGLVPAAIIHEIGIPDEVITLLKRPHMNAEILMQAKWPEYPYGDGQEMLRWLIDQVGVEKLMWGSDMPYSGGFWCTYKQSVDYIRLHCDFLTT
ncbi:MAG: amidohydrolase family protein, partial [Caldilineaceae bacterium]|nr:amidohydrolase family protein [Caldilineaceae bacterium]